MTGQRITVKGYRISKSGKVEKVEDYGLSVSARIAKKKSKRVRVTKRRPG